MGMAHQFGEWTKSGGRPVGGRSVVGQCGRWGRRSICGVCWLVGGLVSRRSVGRLVCGVGRSEGWSVALRSVWSVVVCGVDQSVGWLVVRSAVGRSDGSVGQSAVGRMEDN